MIKSRDLIFLFCGVLVTTLLYSYRGSGIIPAARVCRNGSMLQRDAGFWIDSGMYCIADKEVQNAKAK